MIKHLLETKVQPSVDSHGGHIDFVSYDNGKLNLILGGACSGCAGSTMTLKFGVENMIKHYVPEVHTVEADDDPFSQVDPYYMMDPFMEIRLSPSPRSTVLDSTSDAISVSSPIPALIVEREKPPPKLGDKICSIRLLPSPMSIVL